MTPYFPRPPPNIPDYVAKYIHLHYNKNEQTLTRINSNQLNLFLN
mgnify:CR=1 FL=1